MPHCKRIVGQPQLGPPGERHKSRPPPTPCRPWPSTAPPREGPAPTPKLAAPGARAVWSNITRRASGP
eukprot:4448254-Lingulodinium_polyedra.AAC.1